MVEIISKEVQMYYLGYGTISSMLDHDCPSCNICSYQ
jgi:hypothetical protein